MALLDGVPVENRPFKLGECRQLFIPTYNETLSIVTMCARNSDCSTLGSHG
jgi:hypothetical protein